MNKRASEHTLYKIFLSFGLDFYMIKKYLEIHINLKLNEKKLEDNQ